MKKKADVNWMVVSMVIAVIVLAITAYLFWKYSTQSAIQAQGIASCKARGGGCTGTPDHIEKDCTADEINVGQFSCATGQICCIKTSASS